MPLPAPQCTAMHTAARSCHETCLTAISDGCCWCGCGIWHNITAGSTTGSQQLRFLATARVWQNVLNPYCRRPATPTGPHTVRATTRASVCSLDNNTTQAAMGVCQASKQYSATKIGQWIETRHGCACESDGNAAQCSQWAAERQ